MVKLYHLTIRGRLTIVKSLLLAQYIYIGTVMDILDEEELEKIQNLLNHFVQHNEVLCTPKKWIPDDILYAPTSEGGFNMINVNDFFHSLRNSWIRRYVRGLDDHWADLLDEHLNCNINTREFILNIGAEHPKINKIIELKLPSLSSFLMSYKKIIVAFNGIKEARDNRWINSSIFYNPTIQRRRGPSKKAKSPMETLKLMDIGLKEDY